MRTRQPHGNPDVTQECWKAALDCLRAGASKPQVAEALRPSSLDARARIVGRLKAVKTAIADEPDPSADDQLAELRRIRCAELELPIVQAADQNARKRSALLNELRDHVARCQALAAKLREVNVRLRQVERAGIGNTKLIVAEHNSLVQSLRSTYCAQLSTLKRIELLNKADTNLCDRGLLRSGNTVKHVLELGGAPRSTSTLHRIYRHDKSKRLVEWEFRFSPTLLELLPLLRAGHETLVELRASINSDLQVLEKKPGHTDI